MSADLSLPNDPWTPDEDHVLRQGFRRGLSDREIAAQLPRRTARSVEIRRHRQGLLHYPEKTWDPDEDRQLLELRAQGAPYEELAEVFGRSATALRIRHHRLTRSSQ